jgi:hypothetical protein
MFSCDMAGCVDMAELTAKVNTEARTETLELCLSCAHYLRGYFIGLGKTTNKITTKEYEGINN